MSGRCIKPAKGPLDADFRAVPSKSATHRALVAAAMAEGRSTIVGPLVAEDTQHTLGGLRSLGVRIDERDDGWEVHGTHGRPAGGGTVDLGSSGTSARLLVAFAALGAAPTMLDGSPRLRVRPMGELVDALAGLGASIRSNAGSLPIRAGGHPVPGGRIAVSGARSSQFTSALLLAASGFERGITLDLTGPRVSAPYVRMTVETIEAFGGTVEHTDAGGYSVPAQILRARRIEIEGDHSSTSYHLAAATILGGQVRVRGLRRDSTQPDARFLDDLASLGCRVTDQGDGGFVLTAPGRYPGFSWDLTDTPDLAPTAAVLALFANGPCHLSGLGHLRFKESDRLAILRSNLARLGADVSVDGDALVIAVPSRAALHGARIDSADDHRIAMAFGVAGLAIPGVVIDDPAVVAKSYPEYWADAERIARTGS